MPAKWEYGIAYYENGCLSPHVKLMGDVSSAGSNNGRYSVAHFLENAGEIGWELVCTVDDKSGPYWVFKRQIT